VPVRVGLALGALAACAKAANPPVPESSGSPADLTVEYRFLTRMPTCKGNRRVRIDPDGSVYAATNVAECQPGESWSAPFPAVAARKLTTSDRAELAREIDASGLLAMAEVTDQGVVADGVVEEIEIVRGDERRTIRVVNVTPAPFLRARAAILRAAGELP
jgi:hypothetical protein